MNNNIEDPIAEVHRIRSELLEEYGGIKGYLKHLDDDRPRLEKEGWHFADTEELEALKNHVAV
jgi:hypothetical protein